MSYFQISDISYSYPTDANYYSLYEYTHWKPIPWYSRLFNSIYRCFFNMTGPKFLVPFVGNCFRTVEIEPIMGLTIQVSKNI